MGLHGVFKIEKGIEKTGGLHEALGLSAFCFPETKLVGHDVTDLIDNGFGIRTWRQMELRCW